MGASTTYTISFKAPGGLPKNGKIIITFPSGFDISNAVVAANVKNLAGGFLVTPDVPNRQVTVTRDNTGAALPPDSTGIFSLTVIGNHLTANSYTIAVKTQQNDGTPIDDEASSSPFTLISGALHHVQVLSGASGKTAVAGGLTMTVNQSLTVHAGGFDAFNNYKGDVAVNWKVFGGIGNVAPANGASTTVFTATTTGDGIIRADHPTNGVLDGDSNPIVVTTGDLHHILLRTASNGQGQEFGNYAMTADDSVTVFAAGYDISNNYLGEVPVNWSASGNLSLYPAPSNPSTFYTFSPRAVAIGTIIGTSTAPGVGSDATGTITVNPGKPGGTFTLAANPSSLPINSSTRSRIISSAIKDADGNTVAAGRLFKLSVNNPAFGSIDSTTTVIGTNASGTLSFKFKAGTTPGVATVFANSIDGPASGSVNVNINQIKILAIDAAPLTVSRGQKNIPVNMIVQNIGPDAVTVMPTANSLTFSGNSGDYVVTPPASVSIPGNSTTRTLTFTVTVQKGAKTGSIDLDGSLSGTLSNGAIVSANGAVTKDTWTVQTPPTISYVGKPNGLSPNQVSTGSFYEFQVPIRNAGMAMLELKPDSTTFKFRDTDGDSFVAKLDANRGTQVPGNSATTTLTFRRSRIPVTMQEAGYAPQVRLIGTHNNVRLDTLLTLPSSELKVGQAPPLQIVDITSSQDTVTQGMGKKWTLSLEISNNTSAGVTLESTALTFVKLGPGGGTDMTYRITKPLQFEKGSVLPFGETDFLVFRVDSTGQTTGTMAVFVKVNVKNLNTGEIISAESNGTQKSILVQKPARLRVALKASQSTVTQNQTQPWKVTMTVKNEGESRVKVILSGDSTRTNLASGGNEVSPPANPVIIPGDSASNLDFIVTRTSSTPGVQIIHGLVHAREINSGQIYFDDTSDGDSAKVTVQTPARVRIDSVMWAQTFNADTVNVEQKFKIRVKVKQTTGEEKVDSVRVKLTNRANGTVLQNHLTLTDLAKPVLFEVRAGNLAGTSATFDAAIEAAYSANTGANTVKIDKITMTSSASVYVEHPGLLRIDTVKTSDSKVRFGRTQPWYISIPIANLGGAGVIIDSSRVTFRIHEIIQKDYDIENVTPNAQDTLYGGKRDTLIYIVRKTGTTGGTASITATLFVRDKNSNEKSSLSKTTTILVETTALVTIVRTSFPESVNRVAGTDIALVDTSQVFKIEVTARNTGFDTVRTAWISLKKITAGKSKILTPRAQAETGRINTEGGTAVATFTIQADNVVNLQGETFTAIIDSAATFSAKASIGRPLKAQDTTAVVRIELPARLQLGLLTDDSDNSLSLSQQFKVLARVKNLGQAQTDRTGSLLITRPKGYNFVGNETATKNFAAGDSVEWNVQAPSQESMQDTFVVTMTRRPIDKNSGKRAAAVDTVAKVVVSTFQTLFKIDSTFVLEPEGARDRVLSTEQLFTVAAKIQASTNLSGKQATLTLPSNSGYRLYAGETAKKNVLADTVCWRIQAPTAEHLTTVKFPIEVKAFDGQKLESRYDSLAIKSAHKRAVLQLEPGIKEPGAQDGVVSIGQIFTFVVKLRNTGRASFTDTTKVAIKVPPSITLLEPALEKNVVFEPETYIKEVTWQAQAPSQPTGEQETVTFQITQLPRDINTGTEVFSVNDPAVFYIRTVARGTLGMANLRITGPQGAQDGILSTDQQFIVSDSLYWTDAMDLTAHLILPPNFTTDNEIQPLLNVDKTGSAKLSWRIYASSQKINDAELRVVLKAHDAHNDTSALAPVSNVKLVSVVQRADPRLRAFISNPPAATDGTVSIGQPFEVTAVVENHGEASLSGTATVSLDLSRAPGYSLLDPQGVTKTSAGLTFTWQLRAREDLSNETDYIQFKLDAAPRDTNTNQPATSTLSQFQLAVRTEAKKMLVQELAGGGGPSVRGQKDLLLLRLKLTNPGGNGSSNLVLKNLSVALRDRDQKFVTPNNALKAIQIVSDLQRSHVYGKVETMPGNNPIQVILSDSLVISPDKPDTIAILGDLAENAEARNFRLVFESSQDFYVVDQDSGRSVIVEDSRGGHGENLRIESALTVLFESDPQKSFYNYPNPFHPKGRRNAATYFTYHLPDASNGELKIFTLLGELVWETSFSATDAAGRAGFHKLDLSWDGYNGAGIKVLNGVYVALLKTKFGTFMTKVAVVK
ncbi:MAG: hypothetical protein ONB45_14060 [candidate division KSB1 bacterium]|nr:hypothetical protein [candidate division KSB1 bacterium]